MTKKKGQSRRELALQPASRTATVMVQYALTRGELVAVLARWYLAVGYQSQDPLSGREVLEAIAEGLRDNGSVDLGWAERAGLDHGLKKSIQTWATRQIDAAFPEFRETGQ
jgi:hypothetical protein